MKHDLEYYCSLPYKIEVYQIPEDEGGGFCARLPQFGDSGIIGDGDSIEEALSQLNIAKGLRFSTYLKQGLEIPEPESIKDEFSGRFVTRVPKYLHRQLSISAKNNGVSLNQYVNSLLSTGMTSDVISSHISQIRDELHSIYVSISNMNYTIKTEVQCEVGKIFEGYAADDFERLVA